MERFNVCDKCDKLTEFHLGVEFHEFGFLCKSCYDKLMDLLDNSRKQVLDNFLKNDKAMFQ